VIETREWIGWAAIAAGGIAGACIRWSLIRLATRATVDRASRFDPAWATLAANLLGCFLLGGLLSLPSPSEAPPESLLAAALPAFATTGLCSSLSTFSTLCADAVRQARTAPFRGAIVYLSAHLAGGPLALWLGSLIPL
jgi:fluoride ion exporter CrcB/FEX